MEEPVQIVYSQLNEVKKVVKWSLDKAWLIKFEMEMKP